MKRIACPLAFAALACAFPSCVKNLQEQFSGPVVSVSFTAGAPLTRTAFTDPDGDTYPVLWTENDTKVALSLNHADIVKADVSPAPDFKTARFTATFDEAGSPFTFYLMSPASAAVGIDKPDADWIVEVPTVQTPLAKSVDEAAQILVSKAGPFDNLPGEVNFSLDHWTAYGKLTLGNLALEGAEIEAVALTAGVSWAGRWRYSPDTQGAEADPGAVTITLNTASATDLWFACAPVDLSGKVLTVTVKTDKGSFIKEITLPDGHRFESGKIARFTVDMAGIKPGAPSVYKTERAALEAFYKANNGYNWPDQDNWCTDAALGQWTGVTMTPDGKHVQALEFWYNQVEGFLPEDIANLTELESLSINNQYYSSNAWPLPEAIGSLKKLKSLQFQCYTLGGTLPESLFRLKDLEVLRIINAEGMTPGPIPPEIGNLTGLKDLCLSMIKLTGEVPPEIGNLTNLTKLQLFGNELTGGIPESFGNLVNLEYLDMSANQLSGDIPAAFYRVRNYWMLWPELVEDNHFTQENIRNAKIPAPKSPAIKMLSGKTLDLEEEFARNQYTVIINTGPEFDSWDIFPSLISLYEANKDKGFDVITSYDNNWNEEEDMKEHDEAFKEKLQRYNVPWDSFIRHMNDSDPSAASGETSPFYAKGGSKMYPFGSVDEIVVIGPDRTVHYTTLIDHTEDKAQLQHFMEYIHDVLGSPLVRYESLDFSADGRVSTLQKASVGQGVDIVITGDGYSDRLIADGTFHKAALQAAEDFFSIEPFKSLRERFNVYQVDAVSRNEEIFNGCSTVFSTRFAGATALTGDNETALNYAAKAVSESRMDDVVVLVLVNSGLSGGTAYMMQAETGHYAAGSSVTWVPYENVVVNDGVSSKAMVLIHEAGGHGFGKLNDEYSINYYGKPDKEMIDFIKDCHKKGMFVNVDVTDNPKEVLWSRYIEDGRFTSENIGVYKGGAAYYDGVWRPTENSVMRTNSLNKNNFFNAPSRAQIYTRIMKLSEGQDWQFDYETFVKWDQEHPTKQAASPATRAGSVDVEDAGNEGHIPPVILNGTWRQVIHRQ